MATKKATKPATKKAAGAKSAAMTERETKKRLYAILLFALGAMLLALAAVPGDRVWLSVHEFLLGCFSWCAYLLGPILIYTAVMVDLDKSTFPVGAKVSSCALLIVLLCAASQIFYKTVPEGTLWELMQQLYRLGIELKAGGVFGMIVGMPLLYWLDVTGAAITIIVLIFVALMIISGATIAGLLKKTFVRPVRRMEEAYMSAAEQRAYQEVTQRNSSREITDAGATAFVSEMKRKKPDREPTPAPPQGDRVLDALR
ncbi:MAG: DNA translocase FtsK 4TM domain-containing protein, partial [Angelakisella sp.]